MSWLYVGTYDDARGLWAVTADAPIEWAWHGPGRYNGWGSEGVHREAIAKAPTDGTLLDLLGVPKDQRHEDALFCFEVFHDVPTALLSMGDKSRATCSVWLREVRRPPGEVPESVGDCAVCGKPVRHCYPWWTSEKPRKPIHEECWGAWTAACRPPEEKAQSLPQRLLNDVREHRLRANSKFKLTMMGALEYLLERAAKEKNE